MNTMLKNDIKLREKGLTLIEFVLIIAFLSIIGLIIYLNFNQINFNKISSVFFKDQHDNLNIDQLYNIHNKILQRSNNNSQSSIFLNSQVTGFGLFSTAKENFVSPFLYTWKLLNDVVSTYMEMGLLGKVIIAVIILILLIVIIAIIKHIFEEHEGAGCIGIIIIFLLPIVIGLVCLVLEKNVNHQYDYIDIINGVVHSPRIVEKKCKNNIYVSTVIKKSQSVFDILSSLSSTYRTTITNIAILEDKYSTYKMKTLNLQTDEAIQLRSKITTIIEKNLSRLYDIAIGLHQKASYSEKLLYPLADNIIKIYELSIVNEAAAEALEQKYSFNASVLKDYAINIEDFDKEMNEILRESERLLQNPELVKIYQ